MVAAQCRTWSGWRRWEPVMRYGRLFTPGATAVRARGMSADQAGRKASRLAVDAGRLYAEGYAAHPKPGNGGFPWAWAWCLDGGNRRGPGGHPAGTAYFGVALRPRYLSRVQAAQRGDDGSEGFRWAFTRGDREIPPLDPATDIALDLGRDIPSAVREWALTAERHPGPARTPPGWVLAQLLGARPRPAGQDQFRGCSSRPPTIRDSPAPAGPYARYLVRLADWFNSGMALQCGGRAGGAVRDDGHIVGMIHDGDSVATLMRMADEHRPPCEWETPVTMRQPRTRVHARRGAPPVGRADVRRAPPPRLPHVGRVAAPGGPGRSDGGSAGDPQRRQLRDGIRRRLPGHGRHDAGGLYDGLRRGAAGPAPVPGVVRAGPRAVDAAGVKASHVVRASPDPQPLRRPGHRAAGKRSDRRHPTAAREPP